jgi:hypothetical protein
VLSRIPGVSVVLQPHALRFSTEIAYGNRLIRVLVRDGWTLSYFASAVDHTKSLGPLLPAGGVAGWVLRARPPRAIANSFDIPVEVMFHCTTFTDLQARNVETTRLLASTESRSSREVAFLVTQDAEGDAKLRQIPNSYGVIPLSLDWLSEADSGGLGPNPIRDRIAAFLYAQDLFDQRTPAVGDRFFGRQPDLHRLQLAALNSQHLGLFGLRKIGKTSLLRTFVKSGGQAEEAKEAFLVAYIDLQSIPAGGRNLAYLLWRVGTDLLAAWRKLRRTSDGPRGLKLFGKTDPPAEGTSAGIAFVADLKKLIAGVSRVGYEPFVVVILDEIELLLPPVETLGAFEGGVDFIRLLRGLTQEGKPVSFIASGANPYFAERPRFGEEDNPLLNFVSKHYLLPLTNEEVRGMVSALGARMGLKFSFDALQVIFEQAGGHPFITRQLCSSINASVPRGRPRDITQRDAESAAHLFVTEHAEMFDQVFDALRFYPDERELLDQLVRGDAAFVHDYLNAFPTTLQHLIGYGLVRIDGDIPTLTIPLFREYLARSRGR